LGVVRGVFTVVVWLAVRAAAFVIVAVVMASVLVSGQLAVAASSEMASVPSAEVAQTNDSPDPASQTATGDGTLPFRVLTVAMASLAGILGVFTYWYWRATVPPARRGYSPSVVSPGAEAEHPAGPVGYLRAPLRNEPEDAAPPDLVIAPDFDEAVVDRADVGERTAPSAVGE